MHVKLRLVGGKSAGQEIPIRDAKFLIGRGPQCKLRPKSEAVAEQHCELQVDFGGAAVVDLGSVSGTWVNGQRIEGRRALHSGDVLAVGPLEFEVILAVSTSVAGKKKPKVANVEEAAARMADGCRETIDDVSDWLGPADDNPTAARYAAHLSAEELAAMSTGTAAAAKVPGPVATDTTQTAANEVLNRLLKRP